MNINLTFDLNQKFIFPLNYSKKSNNFKKSFNLELN